MSIDYGFSPVDYDRVPFSDLLGESFDSVEIVDKDQIVFRRKDRVCISSLFRSVYERDLMIILGP